MAGRGKKRSRDEGKASKLDSKRSKTSVSHPSHGDTAGLVLTLGEGDVGQLGLGEDILERTRPALVNLPNAILQVCAGGMHTMCLTDKGELFSFGCNDEGALGRDTSVEGSENTPAKVDLAAKIVQVSAGDSHTAALSSEGIVYAWGNFRDASGSMGLSSAGISKVPLMVLPDETVVKISSGSDHLVCLTTQGEVYTLGCAEQGQLGRIAGCFTARGGRKGLDLILNPGLVRCKKYRSRKMVQFSDIWTGQYMTFAQEKDTGDIYAWGLNNYYQLGFDDMENRYLPERAASFCMGTDWKSIMAGQHHTVALDTEGRVFTLGRADYGRLGHGEEGKELSEPTLVAALQENRCTQIGAGGCVSLAVTEKGTVYAWGMGTSRQLGQAEDDDIYEPTVMGGKQLEHRKVISVDAGGQHTVLLAKDKNGN
ncbi:regulator of chromosome condensation-like [Haliotis rufescens]|uniref:regulator of chromosome condensation-like n=1 Tax=Haliotis rufescens TaxID=6454 RepID=UPI00201EE8E0|nr:regulator of chromosome condensation-like [Haliotis rufescens]